jgi:hypothetical protein
MGSQINRYKNRRETMKRTKSGFTSQYLYQDQHKEEGKSYEYIELPYKLSLLRAFTPKPITKLCNP